MTLYKACKEGLGRSSYPFIETVDGNETGSPGEITSGASSYGVKSERIKKERSMSQISA